MENLESIPPVRIKVEPEFENFVPVEFRNDPFKYFDEQGVNIKSGEVKYDESGNIKEDPTATKDLPIWTSDGGKEFHVVGKKVNIEKGQIGKTGDPFYEYSIMELAREFNLPAPKPVAKVEGEEGHLIVMEKIEGIRWTDTSMKTIHESDLTADDKQNLLAQAQKLMEDLQKRYEEVGIIRTWKLKDMIFDVDIASKTVRAVIPTDWERTKIDQAKLEQARQRRIT